jgi:3'-phosphoadenosine 5'-phosphosulfate sulfotransferase (PAPS reductase)/FAD synthetase
MLRENKLRVLSLGAGVQSSTLALMIEKGLVPKVDCAIFADTGAEPKEVYTWLKWLKKQVSYPVYIVQWRNLKEDLIAVANGTRNVVPIPFFTIDESGKKGIMRRQCTADYKIKPVTKKIRELLGLKTGEKRKANTKVELLMGISKDEIMRMKQNQIKYITNIYPLVDIGWRRTHCIDWFEKNFNKTPPRSACTFCPFHDSKEWLNVKKNEDEWNEVIKLESLFIKNKDIIKKNTGMNSQMFLHKSCTPINSVNFEDKKNDQLDMFNNECEGMCGV